MLAVFHLFPVPELGNCEQRTFQAGHSELAVSSRKLVHRVAPCADEDLPMMDWMDWCLQSRLPCTAFVATCLAMISHARPGEVVAASRRVPTSSRTSTNVGTTRRDHAHWMSLGTLHLCSAEWATLRCAVYVARKQTHSPRNSPRALPTCAVSAPRRHSSRRLEKNFESFEVEASMSCDGSGPGGTYYLQRTGHQWELRTP